MQRPYVRFINRRLVQGKPPRRLHILRGQWRHRGTRVSIGAATRRLASLAGRQRAELEHEVQAVRGVDVTIPYNTNNPEINKEV
jgi:hypothetical protein